jgi:DeoR family transcriptional regulator, fructose operon transcriptional repressor
MRTILEGSARDRQDEILVRILAERSVRIKDLAIEFDVSEMTIRRELDALVLMGRAERVHGGARARQFASEEISYLQRSETNAQAKRNIAVAALRLIDDGDTVGLDASTTALALARLLPARKVRAVLSGFDAVDAIQQSDIEFYVSGGLFHAKARSFVGGTAIEFLQKIHPDKVFFSCNGYTPTEGFTDPNPLEAETKRALLKGGALKVALLDDSKFGRRSLATTAETCDIDIVITNAEPPADALADFEANDVQVIIASDSAGGLN